MHRGSGPRSGHGCSGAGPFENHDAADRSPEDEEADFESGADIDDLLPHLLELLDLVAAGEMTVVIDEVYGLDEIAAAHRHVDGGHKVGNVLVRP